MRISYKNYPILQNIQKGNIKNISYHKNDEPFFKDDIFLNSFFNGISENKESFCKNIFCVSEAFLDAVGLAKKKLSTYFLDYPFSFSGTLIMGKNLICFFNIKREKKRVLYCSFYGFTKDSVPLFFANKDSFWVSTLYNTITKESEDLITKYIFEMSIIVLFKQYAEVETKILEPKKKTKIFGCKYLNETDMKITHLDSKWFTNLVKSDAFKVRGHFRLQPKKKEGKWTKELIWINDFEKSGYTAPARKLTQTQ